MPCASVGRPPEQLRRGTGRSARPAGDRSAGAGRVATPASTLRAECPRLGSARRGSRPARSAKSLLEPRVVAYGGEVIVSARVLAEPREQVNGPSKVGERLVAGVARERRETRVVVIETRVVRHVLEGTADRFERVGVSLFAVGRHGLSVERPRLTPVDPWYASPGVAPTTRTVPSPVAFRRDSGRTDTNVPAGASNASPSTSKVAFPSSTMYSSSWPDPASSCSLISVPPSPGV